jgi:formylglycine-generating enzyme required for sulfatase activity
VPSGAALEVGKSNDGKKCVGVFIHRAAAGQGANEWKGVSLRWLLPADASEEEEGGASEFAMHATTNKAGSGVAFNPAMAEVKVLALEMVYVPQAAFWLGDGTTNTIAGHFTAGLGNAPFRVESEQALKLGGDSTDYLNNHEAVGMEPNSMDDFHSDQPAILPAAFPKGYAAFYCMKYEVTMAMYVEYLNMQPYARQAWSVTAKPSLPAGEVAMDGSHHSPRSGVLIQEPGTPDSMIPMQVARETFVMSGTVAKSGTAAVFKTTMPFVPCQFMPCRGALGFAAWAGLRPMTELEYEKACRGPVKPVADEYPWGTTGIAGMDLTAGGKYVLTNVNELTESIVWSGGNGPDATRGNAFFGGNNSTLGGPTRAGIFATPESDRVTAGATYWGILDMAGSVAEKAVPVGEGAARGFAGTHGEGGTEPWGGIGLGQRGGGYPLTMGGHSTLWGRVDLFRISSRANARLYLNSPGDIFDGMRCVRTAPGGN